MNLSISPILSCCQVILFCSFMMISKGRRDENRYVQPKTPLSGSLLAPVAERVVRQGHMHLQGLPQLQRTSLPKVTALRG